MTTYTILLQRPECIAVGPNDGFFLTAVDADTPTEAVRFARLKAANADDVGECDLTDYVLILIFEGDHHAINHLVEGE